MRVAVASGLAGLAILAAPVSSERGDVGALSDRLARIVEDRMAADGVAGGVVVLIEGGAALTLGWLRELAPPDLTDMDVQAFRDHDLCARLMQEAER